MNVNIPVLLQHVAYSLGAAFVAVLFTLVVGRLAFKAACVTVDRYPKCVPVVRLLPLQTVVFGLVGITLFSPAGMMLFFRWYRLSTLWVPISTSIGLAILGAWIYAVCLFASHRTSEQPIYILRLSRTLFVASPWLCIKPGLFLGQSGGSLIFKGTAQMNESLMWSGVLVVLITSLLIDLTFGGVCFLVNRKS